MVFNNEIKIANECRRKGLDPEEVLQIMQVHSELTENGILFDFDLIPVESLSNYVNYIFKWYGYRLDEGTLNNGVYIRTQILFPFLLNKVYKFKVEIYPNGEKTYLEISKTFRGRYVSLTKKIYGENYSNSELKRIINKIRFLKPSVKGYLICNKCGSYYGLKEGESPNDFDISCECGGTLEYIPYIDQISEKLLEKNKNPNLKDYIRIPLIGIIISLIICFLAIIFSFYFVFIGLMGVLFGLGVLFIQYTNFRKHKLEMKKIQ